MATSAKAWPIRMSAGGGGPWGGAEEVQRADDLLAQPHRQRLHGGEPGLLGGGREPRPAPRGGGQVRGVDGLAGPEAVQAGTLVVLYLEQLKHPGGFAGGGYYAQLAARVSQQQPGGGGIQQLHAAVGQHVQEVDDVEAGDHGVGQLNERLRQQFSVHPGSPSQGKATRSPRVRGKRCARWRLRNRSRRAAGGWVGVRDAAAGGAPRCRGPDRPASGHEHKRTRGAG
jgi:hypothetical protein